jgi:hypothetical protein
VPRCNKVPDAFSLASTFSSAHWKFSAHIRSCVSQIQRPQIRARLLPQ